MFEGFFERRAARKNSRFKVFLEAKDVYETVVQEMRTRFEEMSEEHYYRAREDPRISAAERGFIVALEMSERENALADVAVAKYQLALVYHLRGELDEAALLMQGALDLMSNLPHLNRAANMSACCYHLGIIALKQGRLADAARNLRRSRRMDEANADLGGMQSCDLALAACAKAGANVEEKLSVPLGDARGWEVQETNDEATDKEEAAADREIKLGPVRFDQRELIWLASYSVQANDALMAHLDSLGDEFGRPVGVSRVAFGAPNPEQRHLRQPESDQHVCAAILALERAGLHDPDFQELASACMRRVITVPDFRLLVYLHDLKIDDLRDLADREPFVALLFDTTQIAESPSLDQLRRTLVPYVRSVERIRAAAYWRSLRLRFARACGSLATFILLVAASISLLGLPAWLLRSRLDWLGSHGPEVASLTLGVLAFPLQSPLLFLLLRGMRTAALAPRDNTNLMRWVVMGAVIMLGANHFQHALSGPLPWLFLGLAAGILLDAIRRAGRRARREMIRLESLVEHVADPELQNPRMTVLQGDPLNPFSCPLLPAPSARVFISYTRSSSKISRLATALHRSLKKAGAAPFLDRAGIPAGASWRRSLNQHLGECDVFLCLLDEKGAQREWVAAELLAALAARRLTGTPDIIILMDPALERSTRTKLPVFQGVMAAGEEPPVPGRPQVLQLNPQTQSALAWALAPGRFVPMSVLTPPVALPLWRIMRVVGLIGGLGIFGGGILGALALLAMMARFPLVAGLASRGWLEPMTLLSAFWLGFMARATIAWGCEQEHGREMGMTIPAIAAFGLLYTLFLCVPRVSILMIGWSAVVLAAGWITVASAVRMDVSERRAS